MLSNRQDTPADATDTCEHCERRTRHHQTPRVPENHTMSCPQSYHCHDPATIRRYRPALLALSLRHPLHHPNPGPDGVIPLPSDPRDSSRRPSLACLGLSAVPCRNSRLDDSMQAQGDPGVCFTDVERIIEIIWLRNGRDVFKLGTVKRAQALLKSAKNLADSRRC